MARTLHLAPVGTGKTTRLLAILRELAQSQRHALPKVWVLLATRRQSLSFRRRLIELDERLPVYFNIEFFNFYSLNAHLLKRAGKPVRRLNKLTRYGLLRQLLAGMQAANQLEFFQHIADTRGFVRILADFVDELKQAGVDVDDFAAAAQSNKDRELALIYRRYQDLLRRSELADVEGEGWLALATLRRQREIASDVDLLLVDGYDQFTLIQARMLAALAKAISNVHITLTDIPGADAEALPHRSLLARTRLQRAFEDAQVELGVETIEPVAGERSADLELLSERIFRDSPVAAGGSAIQLIEMPNPAEEVKSVLRKIKRQLLDGIQPDDILVALRDWSVYATQLETGREEYELPLLLQFERGLAETPVIAVMMDLLGMTPRFFRRDLLDVLRSPYIDSGLDAEQIDLLDRISRERQFLGGAASDWLDIVSRAGRPSTRESEDDPPTVLSVDERDKLHSCLSAFLHGITPVKQATAAAYVDWLQALLGAVSPPETPDASSQQSTNHFSLDVFERARQDPEGDAEIIRRDLEALAGLKRILRDIATRDDVLGATFGEAPTVEWRQFWPDLKHALETTAAEPNDRSRVDQVLVATATEARGLPHRHVYILGLAEGVFPAEIPEDPLYLDSERVELKARGIPLAAGAERIDDQGLFYELIGLPRESLTLSRPTFRAGKVWIESHLWRAARRVFPHLDVETSSVGSVVKPEEAASPAEALLGVAAQLNGSSAAQTRSALRIKTWLQLDPELATQWRRVEAGQRVELGRLSNAPFDGYSGVLTRPDLLEEVARRLGSEHVWSASQLKDYGLCGFRYFAKRLLQLDEIKEPATGIDDLQLGQLCHSILEATYRRIRTSGIDINERNLDEALSIFSEQAKALVKNAPEEIGFHASATWEEEAELLLKRLSALIALDFSSDSPLNRFGGTRRVRMLERGFRDAKIELPGNMPPVRVSGIIDRIDWGADDKLILVDYKTGSGAISRRQMEIGRDFQMLIYVLAMHWLERHAGESRLAGGMFWHLRNLRASGIYSADNDDDLAAIETARGKLADNLRQGRHGQFPVQATELDGGRCARYCEFSHLCRMQVTSQYKRTPPV